MELLSHILVLTFGLCIGSFVNAWIWRTRENKSIFFDRSECVHCNKKLKNKDLVPIFSFLFLKGKCRYCDKKISIKYPLVELWFSAVFLFIFIFNSSFFSLEVVWGWFVATVLSFLFLYDLYYNELPDIVTLPSIVLIFLFNIFLGEPEIKNMLIAGASVGGFFLAQFILSRGTWIGGGDIRLGFLMGVILGWPLGLLSLVLAYIFGAFASVGLLIAKKVKMNQTTPFGTYLAVATLLCVFWGDKILNWYLSLLF